MRRAGEGAAGRDGHPDQTAGTTKRAEILAFKRALGNCINCGQHIVIAGGPSVCGTCSAWQRWYTAFKIASEALREATR